MTDIRIIDLSAQTGRELARLRRLSWSFNMYYWVFCLQEWSWQYKFHRWERKHGRRHPHLLAFDRAEEARDD